MDKVTLSSKVFTENPLLDEIVYNIRQLATGTVLKDEDKANNSETLESLQYGDILVAINQGNVSFSYFDYDEELISLFVSDPELVKKYAENNDLIPQSLRPQLLNKACELFEENYVEYNNYYRMLHGEPDYDESDMWKGLFIDKDSISEDYPTSIDYIYPYESDIPGYNKETGEYDTTRYLPIHELSITLINILDSNGTLSNIVADESWITSIGLEVAQVRYLNFIGEKAISYYDARTAEKFMMLYCPSCDSEEVRNRYKELFEANRLYMLYTTYSDAYKFKSDYYDNFIMVFLVLQTFVDMIVELPEYIIRRDVFDTRTCKYIFESNGVKYFKDIPLRYQISLVKNLNKLIKFKSTDKCIVDIISLFGFKNINAFRYYILKDRNVGNPEVLDYYDNHKENEEGEIVEDNDTNYDLKFIRVPLQEGYDDYARFDENVYTYDDLVDTDSYWGGDKTYEDVKSEIKDIDFTILRSKYYSVEAIVDLTQRNFNLVYFLNMLLYNNIDRSKLKVSISTISTNKKFELTDVIIALYSLGYVYYGTEDIILDSRSKIFQILGFNLQVDMGAVATYLSENFGGLTLKDLHADNFTVPDEKTIVSYDQLQNIFINNKEVYEHVKMVMANPPSKEVYDAYRYLRKTLFVMNCNMEYFLTESSIVEEYKNNGYDVKFVNVPKPAEYSSEEVYKTDYEWFLSTLNNHTLYLSMSDNFESNHTFDLYIYDGTDLVALNGTATMAYTLREFLSHKSATLYKYIENIASITNESTRQESAINAIQNIVDCLNNYIDEEHIGAYLDEIFSGLPSISIDFVRKYIEEVIDFFKSFKIFTHQSSVIYVIDDKYEEYVQLIDHVLLKYLFDKSEYIKIEDFVYGNDVSINKNLRYDLIDKAWLSINTWAKKEISEYYENNRNNNDTTKIRYKKYYCPNCGTQIDQGTEVCPNCGEEVKEPMIFSDYEEYQNTIRDYLEAYSTRELYDTMMAHKHPDPTNIKYEIPGETPEEKEKNRKEIYAMDALIRLAVDMNLRDSRDLGLKPVTVTTFGYKCPLCGAEVEESTTICPSCNKEIIPERYESSNDFCPYCGKSISSSDEVCPHCKKPISGNHIAADSIYHMDETRDFDDMYNEFMIDLRELVSTYQVEDGSIHCITYYCPYCDTQLESATTTTCPTCGKLIPEPISKIHYKTHIKDSAPYYSKLIPSDFGKLNDTAGVNKSLFEFKDKCIGSDNYYLIVTQEFPAHEFQ